MFIDLDLKPANKEAIVDSDGDSLTYGEIKTESDRFAEFVSERAIVFVLCNNSVGGCLGFLNCMATRRVPLMLSANMDAELLEQLISIYHPAYIWKPASKLLNSETALYNTHGYVLISTGEKTYPIYDELSMLLTTSGSTGSPKLVRHSYSNIESQARNISAFFEIDDTERALLDLPIHYTMGLSVLYSHLYIGATVYITSMNVLDVEYWTFVKNNHITSITNIPYTFELLYKLRFFNMKLPDLRIVTQGGGKLKDDIYKAFAEFAFDTGRRFIPTYGQTEGSARMAFLPAEFTRDKIACIGKAIPGGRLYLIDEDGNLIEDANIVGEMIYEGPNVTLGYAQKAEDLELGDERKGVLPTGDLARMDEDGFFYIVGRKKRFLKINGHRVGLDEIEQIIKKEYDVDCACTGTDKCAIIYITCAELSDQIRRYISNVTKLNISSFEVRVMEKIPRNEAGKILYSKLNVE